MSIAGEILYSCFQPSYHPTGQKNVLNHGLSSYVKIRGESNPTYDQTVLTITENHCIDAACIHTSEDLFKKMRKASNLEDKMKCLHHAIPIFKGPLKHASWIYYIRINVQEKFKI